MSVPSAGPSGGASADKDPSNKPDGSSRPPVTQPTSQPKEGKQGEGALLKSYAWFPAPPPASKAGLGAALAKLGVGALAGGAFFALHKPIVAYVVWGVAGTIGLASIASAPLREAIDGFFARVGRALGTFIGTILLSIVYVVVLTPIRAVRRALGADDLHLRDKDRTTFWLPCDAGDRKVKHVGAMFATEPLGQRGGHPLRNALLALAVMLLLAEGILRFKGFGNAVLYHADPVVGYYPAPNQNLGRYGGRVMINSFGMRSPEIAKDKPAGVFRILMLGDSTLYGGSYIDQDDLYANKLGALLEKKGAGKVEVLVMGTNGWGPFHERGYVSKFGTFDADIAIINLPVDDINRPLYGLMSVPFFGDDNPPKLGLEEVMNHFMWRYRSAHAGLNDAWEREQSQLGIAEYGRLVSDLLKTVPEVFTAILPGKSAGMGGPDHPRERAWRDQLVRELKEHGSKIYYAKGYFKNKGTPKEIYYDGVHLDVKGHIHYATFLADHLMTDSKRYKKWTGGGE